MIEGFCLELNNVTKIINCFPFDCASMSYHQCTCYTSKGYRIVQLVHGARNKVLEVVGASFRASTVKDGTECMVGVIHRCMEYIVRGSDSLLQSIQVAPLDASSINESSTCPVFSQVLPKVLL